MADQRRRGRIGESDALTRTLPVVDPQLDMLPNQFAYFEAAQRQRNRIAGDYLNQWNNKMMAAFDQIAKMSQFGNLWRGFTCGQLDKLLNKDYPEQQPSIPTSLVPRPTSGQPLRRAGLSLHRRRLLAANQRNTAWVVS